MNLRIRALILSSLPWLLAGQNAQADVPPRATVSAAELRAQLSRTYGAIESLRVEYEVQWGDSMKPEGGMPLRRVLRVVALKAPDRAFAEIAHDGPVVPARHDPFLVRMYLSADKLIVDRPLFRQHSTIELPEGKPVPSDFEAGQYVRSTGIWPLKHQLNEHGFWPLSTIAQSEDFSVVREAQETVGQTWCHVLEHQAGSEALWIDTSHMRVAARERFNDKRVRIARFEFGDFVASGPDVWLPRRIESWKYDLFADTAEKRSRVTQNSVVVATKVSVNDVEDGVFQFAQLPGSAERDAKGALRQIQAGGVDLLDRTATWSRTYFENRSNGRPYSMSVGALLPIGTVLFGIAIAEVLRRFQRKNR